MPSKLCHGEEEEEEVPPPPLPHRGPFLVSVEGNVGSGKSTMLEFFRSFDDVQLCPEPVPKW